MNGKPYTTSEIKNILDLFYNQKESVKDIAIATDRTEKAIFSAIARYKHMATSVVSEPNMSKKAKELVDNLLKKDSETESRAEEVAPVKVEPLVRNNYIMAPRDMIKYLYSLGYRIKNNELVVLVEQKVNLKDIING